MPQSSSEMQEAMRWIVGGNGIDDSPVIKFLEERGYKLTHDWLWVRPKPDHWITVKEELCVRFLIEEWDFGPIVP